MIEAIKLIGSIAGLATAAFVIWDRLVRGRPLAYIVLEGEGLNPSHYLRVQNVGNVSIIIRGVHSRPPGRISKDHSVDAIAWAAIGDAPAAIIDPGSKHDFVLLASGADDDAPSTPIWLVVSWRRTSATWLPLPPKVVRTSTGDLRRLEQAYRRRRH